LFGVSFLTPSTPLSMASLSICVRSISLECVVWLQRRIYNLSGSIDDAMSILAGPPSRTCRIVDTVHIDSVWSNLDSICGLLSTDLDLSIPALFNGCSDDMPDNSAFCLSRWRAMRKAH
jgi:hypothetical protein